MRAQLFATVRVATLFAAMSTFGAVGCGVPIVGAGNPDAGTDTPLCRPGETQCGDECVVVSADRTNCGACGTTCAEGDVCVSGTCETACPRGQLECDGVCRDVSGDRLHCGACGLACMTGQVCSGGTCGLTCETGLEDCSGNCRDLSSDRSNCGACGITCGSGQVCSDGVCSLTCGSPLTECEGVCRDLQTDRLNCGGCGMGCMPGQVCSAGMCEVSCGGGLTDCDGTCRDLTNDRLHCGACGTTCADGQVCSEGACAASCASSLMLCGDVCRDLQTDRANCGACGTMCAAGEVCSAGVCETSCGAGLNNCTGVCRDLQTDRANCGACGTSCSDGLVCVEGACVISCGAGLNACMGVCRDYQTDRNNCGSCGNVCDAGDVCIAGSCELSCAAPQVICGSACVDTRSDRANCGACGTACGAGQVCSMGVCTLSCGGSLTECSGDCVSTRFDPQNCGACGTTCGPYANATASCSDRCIMTCNGGFGDCDTSTATGCESEFATNVNHCGRCGNRCSFPNAAASCASNACVMGACNAGYADCDGRSANGCECRTVVVGSTGDPFSGGTIRDLDENPTTGAISPSGMVTTTSRDFLWVVNVRESTVSRWDASMRAEVARYRVGLPSGECAGRCCWESGCNMPSRVVVDGNGDAYIANRAFDMQGTVTKIAGDRAECIDRNGNGMIDTATSATPLAWGADECVLWTANVGAVNAVLRAITIDRGDAARPNGYVWVGAFNTSQFFRLDPRDGSTLNTLSIGLQPYGAVVTSDGRLWATYGNRIQPIDTTTRVVGTVVNLPFSLYGPTADALGRLWFSPVGGALYGYNPMTGQSTQVPLRSGSSLGVTSDALGNIWVGLNEAGRTSFARMAVSSFVGGPAGGAPGNIPASAVTYFDGPANPSGAFPSAVGVDRSGAVWLAHYNGDSRLLRLDPMTSAVTTFSGPNMSYSYSDFTGSVRRASIPQGSYEQTFDLGCANPVLSTFEVAGSFPAGTTTNVSMRTAATVAGLATATPVPVASIPPLASPYNMATAFSTAGVAPSAQLRVTMSLRAGSDGAVPSVSRINLVWTCP
jgi:streptogramin lyase